jgi:hypothetical protein
MNTSKPPKSSSPRRLPHITDLIFKHLLHLSPKTLIHFINGLFGSSHPPNSSVHFPATETVSRGLRRLISDTHILIGGRHAYHIELQSSSDARMAIRVFEYGFAGGLLTKTVRGNVITVRFPEARIIYINPARTTPHEMVLRLEFPGGGCDYRVRSFRLFDRDIAALAERNMHLLLPFYVLKLRGAVKSARSAQRRRELAAQMKGLLEDIMKAAGGGVRAGILDGSGEKTLIEHTERLFRELYTGYTEFKESNVMMQDRILTYSEEVAIKVRNKTRREEAKRYREREKIVVEKAIEKTREEIMEQTALETAKKMKALKIPMKQIAVVSGLPLDEIKKL